MRIVITLPPEERQALGVMAHADLRDPRDQIRYMLRQEAARRGLLSVAPEPHQPAPEVPRAKQ